MDLQTLIEIGTGVVTFLVAASGALGSVWLFFRRRLRAWWMPYREGIQGMSKLPELSDEVHLLVMKMQARWNTAPEAMFECDRDGRNVEVNRAYARMLGATDDELRGYGFINFIHPDDRATVRAEWEACRREHRTYEVRHRMVTSAGKVLQVVTTCCPVPDAPPPRAWMGTVRVLAYGE